MNNYIGHSHDTAGVPQVQYVANLVVGAGVDQRRLGAPARSEQIARCNRLTDIEAASPLPLGLGW